jgi:hypothetical protein
MTAAHPATPDAGSQTDIVLRRFLGGVSIFTLLMTVPQVLVIWITREAAGVSVLSWSAYLKPKQCVGEKASCAAMPRLWSAKIPRRAFLSQFPDNRLRVRSHRRKRMVVLQTRPQKLQVRSFSR